MNVKRLFENVKENSCCTQPFITNTMASDVCWNNLPSVVLLEIFKRISHEERINASSTCKEWRKALFFPNFWRELSINIYSKNDKYSVERCQFFTRSFMSSSRNVKIVFSYKNAYMSQVVNILAKLAGNRQLQRLYLFSLGQPMLNQNISSCVKNLKTLVENVRNLNTFYISHCWSPLLENDKFKSLLEKQKESLVCLGIGPVCCDKSIESAEIHLPVNLSVHHQLSILSLDHMWITDEILNEICDLKMLKTLIIQLSKEFKGNAVGNLMWDQFHQSLPDCELKVYLMLGGNREVLQVFTDSMPVTHIKILYCEKLDLASMSIFSAFKDLKSIWYLGKDKLYEYSLVENPIVMCAWTCKNLEELVVSGIQFDYNEWVGVARLREEKLKKLDVDETDIVELHTEGSDSKFKSLGITEMNKFIRVMSKDLGRPWSPTDSSTFKKPNLPSFDNQITNIIEILSQDFEH